MVYGCQTETFKGEGAGAGVSRRLDRVALDHHFSDRDRLCPHAAFKTYRGDIEAHCRRKYLLGRREPDGLVLIRTGNIARQGAGDERAHAATATDYEIVQRTNCFSPRYACR